MVASQQAGSSSDGPIAVIGMGCALPAGASTPEKFWDALEKGVDGVIETPAERWSVDEFYATSTAPGKMITKWGGFLTDPIDTFDPPFFGISKREADGMDPQQRMILQTTHQALEHAGQPPFEVPAAPVGVFVGIFTSDYQLLQARTTNMQAINGYFGTGNSASVAAGRVSYIFGFEGPAVALDTACSSALVAAHLASQSLSKGECSTALASGVNLMLAPDMTINFSQAGMMSPVGRCKTFDASADGYVRGEGCGVVVLKKLADATADGDVNMGVIRGTAINQDGRSSGLTAPNGRSQQTVIRSALATASVAGADIGYIEAHGTGTPLGDPIEVQSLAAVLSADRKVPLVIGSVKTNIGHLEAAAGAAGLMKVLMTLERKRIPGNLHFNTPNPMIPLDAIPATVPTGLTPWPSHHTAHVAGVSSFGFSGTNSHAVVAAAPAVTVTGVDEAAGSWQVCPLTAASEESLRATASAFGGIDPSLNLKDVCFTAATAR